MKRKFVLLALVFGFFAIGFGCDSSFKEEEEPGEEPVIQEETFGDFEALPKWLQGEITAYKAEMNPSPDGYFRAEKGEWEGQTIYNIHISINSVAYDFRYENGERLDVTKLYPNMREATENWVYVYEWAKGFHLQMFGKGNSSMSGPRPKS